MLDCLLFVSPTYSLSTYLILCASPTSKVSYLHPAFVVTQAWPKVNLKSVDRSGANFIFNVFDEGGSIIDYLISSPPPPPIFLKETKLEVITLHYPDLSHSSL